MTATTPLMAGKKGLIMGLANDKSIAWGIAQALDAPRLLSLIRTKLWKKELNRFLKPCSLSRL